MNILDRMKRDHENSNKTPSHSAGTGRRLTPAEQKAKMASWPKSTPAHRKAERIAQKADPHYEMADSPMKTKGQKAYNEALHKKSK